MRVTLRLYAMGVMLAAMAMAPAARAVVIDMREEVPLAESDYKRLDTFEGVLLAKADKVFGQGEFRSAAAEYDAFILQYPKSLAIPYAVMRKARSMQRDNKRNDAIKLYNEVLDYFPNSVDYAGAALYYIGQCHSDNGDVKEAMKSWAEMAQDKDYRKHFLAAVAINRLGDNLVRQDKWPEAVAYYQQVAVDFRRSNREAANYAISKTVECFVRATPDAAKLRSFYDKVESFEDSPRTPEDGNYWWRVMEAIDRYGTFNEADKANRDRYFQYWVGVMDGKNLTWDDYQINVARYKLNCDGDATKWMERLDQQFAQHQKEGDYGRVVKWIGLYAGRKAKIDEYYAKLAFDKMANGDIQSLIQTVYERSIDVGLARNAIGKLKPDTMTDDARENLARWIWQRDEEGVRLVCAAMKDADRGKMTMVRFFQNTRQPDKGLKLADELTKVPMYAKEAYWTKGEFLQWKRQWADAISAYRLGDNPPSTIFRIAECMMGDGKRDQAIAQLREIEGFFPKDAPEAGWRVALAYRDTGDQKQYIAALRGVMKKYPASGQSSDAHLELERLGVKIGGGVDAE